jgi:squalene-hopene/tetraprenyl-beta-curcumene cyclase
MKTLLAFTLLLLPAPAYCGDWNARAAAEYLDGRQKEWFAWPVAKTTGGVCVSCHTGATYLIARSALRRALDEGTPTEYEAGLTASLRARVDIRDPQQWKPGVKEPNGSQMLGVEAVWAALFLASEDAPRGKLSAETEKAFDRLWALQRADGDSKGAWHWNSLDLDPWEMPDSEFFGAAMAALATGLAPGDYQSRPAIRANLESLRQYLRSHEPAQPLHNRLVALWASSRLGETLAGERRHAILNELWKRQQDDGGWTLEALGAWKARTAAPQQEGSNSYATALAAFTAQTAGVRRNQPALARALTWLEKHQDRESGSWNAASMNKEYKPDTMPLRFMRDAATAYAALALIGTY